MNNLSTTKRIMIPNVLVEGMSIRDISRAVGVSINTVSKLLVEAGGEYHDKTVADVHAKHVWRNEIWSFCYAKK